MSKGYWIARVDVFDIEQYMRYVSANAAPLAQYAGRFLVRGGQYVNSEGTSRSRNVVIEFPSYEAALACWESPEYQSARSLRADIAESDLVIVQGYCQP